MSELKMISLSEVESKPVSYLWEPYIAQGTLTMIFGNTGTSKSWLTMAIATAVANGLALPGSGKPLLPPSNVILQNTEIALESVIRPRLDILGTDCSRVFSIDVSDSPLSLNDDRIEEAILKYNAKLFCIDPIQAHLSKDISMNRAESIRPAFTRLSGVAERTGCAIIMVGHYSKSRTSSVYKGLGSVDVINAVPNVLYVGHMDKADGTRAVVHGKSNISEQGDSQCFRLTKANGFEWLGVCDMTLDDVTSNDRADKKSKMQLAEEFFFEALAEQAMPSAELARLAQEQGISSATYRRAREKLCEPTKDSVGWSTRLKEDAHLDSNCSSDEK